MTELEPPDLVPPPERAPRIHPWRISRWGAGWSAVFGLTGFAAAVPLFRVLGPSPEFFVAHRIGPSGVVLFAIGAAVGVPAVVATAVTVAGVRSRLTRGMAVAAVGTVAAAGVLQPLAGVGVFPLLAVLSGAAIAWFEVRVPSIRTGLSMLTAMSLLAGVWFVGLSRTSTYVFAGDASVVDVVEVADRPLPPVVVLVFDELPAPALLRSDLTINAERFPNFARLAGQSDWYRVASSVSPQTGHSVPALLSGTTPTGAVGVASNYPSNLFLQLGGLYHTFGYEPVTGLCPAAVCEDHSARADGPSEPVGPTADSLVNDMAVVFGHAVGSDAMRADLAPIDHSWSGFDARPIDLVRVDADPDTGQYRELGNEATFVGASTRLLHLTAQRPDDDRPPMYVAHLITPHLPYIANPSGTIYPRRPLVGMETENSTLAWPPGVPEAARRQGYQRLLLQLGAVDRILGQVIDQLEQDGVWDRAAVVVTADHGASFEEGSFRDVGKGGAEVWNVPLFVKHPGQRDGMIRDDAALTIDVVPTLLGILGVDSPTTFDGVDLDGGEVPGERRGGYHSVGGRVTIDQSINDVREVVARRSAWIDPDGGWPSVYRVGPGAELVGSDLPTAVVDGPGSWQAGAPPGEHVPTVQRLTLQLDDAGPVPSGVVVAAGGRVVGTGAPLIETSSGTYQVTVVIDEAAGAEGTVLDVLAVGADNRLTRLRRE